MYKLSDIDSVHLELSSFCNARCPRCTRNFYGAEINTGYVEHNMTLAEAKKIFPESFVSHLKYILYNGNLGDMVMNSETLDISKWFLSVNPNLFIEANTNGGAGTTEFWESLAEIGIVVNFAIDGLEDTHHLYRQNTSWSRILHNAKTFIAAGGVAHWKMIKFNHNEHQLEQCKTLSEDLGFAGFEVNFFNRNHNKLGSPAFDKQGTFSHAVDNYQRTTDINTLQKIAQNNWTIVKFNKSIYENVDCYAQKKHELFVNSLGEVYPCCFIGANPKTINPLSRSLGTKQLKPLVESIQNNALEYSLEKCIDWFNLITDTWKKDRLYICDIYCGTNEAVLNRTKHNYDNKIITKH